METPRKDGGKLEIKNTVIEMKNSCYGVISRLAVAEERVAELEGIP